MHLGGGKIHVGDLFDQKHYQKSFLKIEILNIENEKLTFKDIFSLFQLESISKKTWSYLIFSAFWACLPFDMLAGGWPPWLWPYQDGNTVLFIIFLDLSWQISRNSLLVFWVTILATFCLDLYPVALERVKSFTSPPEAVITAAIRSRCAPGLILLAVAICWVFLRISSGTCSQIFDLSRSCSSSSLQCWSRNDFVL